MTDAAKPNDYISVTEFREAEGTQDWPVLSNGATTFFRTDSLATSARLVQAISRLADIEEHRPSIDVRADGVTVRLLTMTQDWCGMSQRDVEAALRISTVAAELDLGVVRAGVQGVRRAFLG